MVLHRLALHQSTKLHTFCIFTVDYFHFTNKVSLFKTILSTNWSRNRNRCSFAVRLAQYHESIKKKYAPFCEPSPAAHLSQYILCNSTYPFIVYPLQQNLCCIALRVKCTIFCIRRSGKDFSQNTTLKCKRYTPCCYYKPHACILLWNRLLNYHW